MSTTSPPRVRARPQARLSVRVDGNDNLPVPAVRTYVYGPDGRLAIPAGAITLRLARPFGREEHAVVPGQFDVDVPAGRVSIRLERGPEFLPVTTTVALREGEHRALRLRIPRWVDMPADGWFPGDLHGHRDADHMPLLMAAEELSVGSAITAHNGRMLGTPARSEPPEPVGGRRSLTTDDIELERLEDGTGALVGLDVRRAERFRCGPWTPLETTVAERIRSRRGHVDLEKPFWRLAPVLVARGLVDSVGVACNHFGRTWSYPDIAPLGAVLPPGGIASGAQLARWICELYYRFLDCGYRPAVSGGSASGWMPNPPGFARTYVRTGGSFGHAAWYTALRGGRSFATTGPLLWLDVAGRGPGESMPPDVGQPLRVSVRVRSAEALDRLELVRDGEIVAESRAIGGEVPALEVELDARAGGWLCARAFGAAQGAVRFAHTSPVYLGRPSRRRGASARALRRRVTETVAHLERRPAPRPPKALVAVYQGAADVYRALE